MAFFQPRLDWLRRNPDNRVSFLVSSNRSEANPFVLFGSGELQMAGANELRCTGIRIYFSDRFSNVAGFDAEPFDPKQTESEAISIDVVDGTLLRINPINEGVIGRYSQFECKPNGLLVCTSDLTREILLLSFQDITVVPIQ
jgi:hypothetical protein